MLLRLDATSLLYALAAPAVGSAVALLVLMAASLAGAPMQEGAPPLLAVLFAGSLAVLAVRRPRISRYVVPFLGVCVVGLLLIGRPMLTYGLDWIANANDDAANYMLAATTLLDHGLLAPLDVAALTNDRAYAGAFQIFQLGGVRPGGNVMLSGLAAVVGLPPYQLFMPLTLAMNLCAICGAGSLAIQSSRRWIAALLAAALLAVSPLSTYGVVQQLLPQVWGLALAAVLVGLLFRPELHSSPGPQLKDTILIGVVAAAVVLVYVELAATLALAYALFLALLVARRRIALRPALRLWTPALVVICLTLSVYLLRLLVFVTHQTGYGLKGGGEAPLFGYSLIPAALPAILGVDKIVPAAQGADLSTAIALSAFLLAAILVAALVTAARLNAAAVVLVTYALLGALLAAKSSDFGLFKLYMYVQPFLAAAAAVWIADLPKRWLGLLFIPFGIFIGAQLQTQTRYVTASREPIDLADASDKGLLPTFQRFLDASPLPVVSVTENPVLIKLEAARAGDHPLHFVSRDVFTNALRSYADTSPEDVVADIVQIEEHDVWQRRTFDVRSARGRQNAFNDNVRASSLLARGRCRLVFPTGRQLAFNRLLVPERLETSLAARPCSTRKPLLVFTQSQLGGSFYLFANRKRVSFYQPEPDYFNHGETFVGFGRYALFRVVGGARPLRLELNLTATLRHDGRNELPPAAVIGAARTRLPLAGRGSARVYSAPLRPQVIAGQPYVLLDMGRDGRLFSPKRTGIQALYSASIPLDTRYLTSYVRDVSVVTDDDYRRLDVPAQLSRFPVDLRQPGLEYSGLYEDGWVGERSFVKLRGGPAARLLIRADVPARSGQRLRVLVDGRPVFAQAVPAGPLEVRARVPASRSRRRVELIWGEAMQLPAPDLRPAAAFLKFVGVVPP